MAPLRKRGPATAAPIRSRRATARLPLGAGSNGVLHEPSPCWALGELVLEVRNQASGESDPSRLGMLAGVHWRGSACVRPRRPRDAAWARLVFMGLSAGLAGHGRQGVVGPNARPLFHRRCDRSNRAAPDRRWSVCAGYATRGGAAGMLMAILGFGIALDSWGSARRGPVPAAGRRLWFGFATRRRCCGANSVSPTRRTPDGPPVSCPASGKKTRCRTRTLRSSGKPLRPSTAMALTPGGTWTREVRGWRSRVARGTYP